MQVAQDKKNAVVNPKGFPLTIAPVLPSFRRPILQTDDHYCDFRCQGSLVHEAIAKARIERTPCVEARMGGLSEPASNGIIVSLFHTVCHVISFENLRTHQHVSIHVNPHLEFANFGLTNCQEKFLEGVSKSRDPYAINVFHRRDGYFTPSCWKRVCDLKPVKFLRFEIETAAPWSLLLDLDKKVAQIEDILEKTMSPIVL